CTSNRRWPGAARPIPENSGARYAKMTRDRLLCLRETPASLASRNPESGETDHQECGGRRFRDARGRERPLHAGHLDRADVCNRVNINQVCLPGWHPNPNRELSVDEKGRDEPGVWLGDRMMEIDTIQRAKVVDDNLIARVEVRPLIAD